MRCAELSGCDCSTDKRAREEAAASAPTASAASKIKEGDPEETQTVSQKQFKELEARLNKLETANTDCKCTIA